MKRTTLLGVLLAVCLCNLYGQQKQFLFSLKAGANFSNAVVETEYSMTGKPGQKLGYQVGVTAEYSPKGLLYFGTGLSFTNKGAKFSGAESWIGGSNPPVTNWEKTTNQAYLQIPLTIGYYFPVSNETKISVNAGPYLAYGVGGKETVKTHTTPSEAKADEKFTYNTFDKNNNETYSPFNIARMDYGAALGVGLRHKKFIIGFDYEMGLMNIFEMDQSHISSLSGKYKNRNMALTVGYVLK